jgi:hypothetical protein
MKKRRLPLAGHYNVSINRSYQERLKWSAVPERHAALHFCLDFC